MNGLISINGHISKPEEAKISVFDRGFQFGDSIFEVMVGFHGIILETKEHLERLRSSADKVGIPIPWSNAELESELKELSQKLKSPKNYFRLVITRGISQGIGQELSSTPNKIIYALEAQPVPERFLREGIKLKRKNSIEHNRNEHAKTSNYLNSIVAIEQAKKEGFDDILWTNIDGEITEASTANVFFIGRQGDLVEIVTPPARSGLLKGITRSRVISLLTQAKIRSDEMIISQDELARFDEAFICSTVKGLIPVKQIDKKTFHTTRTNSVFKHINRLYNTWVHTELGFAVEWNTGKKIATS